MSHIEVLGESGEASRTGLGLLRLEGQTSIANVSKLQHRMEKEFGILKVLRKGLAAGGFVRITPQVFNTPER